jgi:hypothetical protein
VIKAILRSEDTRIQPNRRRSRIAVTMALHGLETLQRQTPMPYWNQIFNLIQPVKEWLTAMRQTLDQ